MRNTQIKAIYLFCILLVYSCSSPVSEKNAENIKKVEIGMTLDEVLKIMNNPEKVVIYPYNNDEYVYLYTSPTGYSDNFRIYISRRDSIVLRIGDGL